MIRANDIQHGGDHYQTKGVQHWDFTWEFDYNQFEYCVSKYVSRCWKKNGMEDLDKAEHHLRKYIELTNFALPCKGRVPKDMLVWTESQELDSGQVVVLIHLHMKQLKHALEALETYKGNMEGFGPGITYVNPDL